MEMIIFVLYSAWAVYSGNKMVSGRIDWLEEPGAANKICKAMVSLIAGYAVGVFYLAWWVIKLACKITDGSFF